MKNQPFFTRDHDTFIPMPVASGPWDPNSLHGRVIIGLLAFAVEQRHGADDFVPARLTVDMFRLPTLAPIEVTTKLIRDGQRIKVVEADFYSGGVSMAHASCQSLRKTQNPQGRVWSPLPAPADITVPEDPRLGMHGKWTVRPIVGSMGTVGPRRLWMREVRDLVEGAPLTPFVRVAVAADFASPFANAGDQGLAYINSDVTLYLHRLPVKEWIGFEVVNHHATDGVAIGECFFVRPAGSDRDFHRRRIGATQGDGAAGDALKRHAPRRRGIQYSSALRNKSERSRGSRSSAFADDDGLVVERVLNNHGGLTRSPPPQR